MKKNIKFDLIILTFIVLISAAILIVAPQEGYYFVKWTDGIKTAIRNDTNIISQNRVFAIFEKIE